MYHNVLCFLDMELIEQKLSTVADDGSKLTQASALEVVDQLVADFQTEIAEAVRDLIEVCDGRQLLVLDSALGYNVNALRSGLDRLEAAGYCGIKGLVIDRLFDGRMPGDFSQFFKGTFGRLPLRNIDVRDPISVSNTANVAGAILSGSAACITKVQNGLSGVLAPDLEITDVDVLRNNEEFYRGVREGRWPAFGICFGHQFLAHVNGGRVFDLPEMRQRIEDLEEVGDGAELLLKSLGLEARPDIQGLCVVHQNAVIHNPRRSRQFLYSSDDQRIVHGLISLRDGQFSEDANQNTALVCAVLDEGEALDLSMQSHPEISFFKVLFAFTNAIMQGRKLTSIKVAEVFRSIKNFIILLTKFFAAHKSFGR